MKADGSLNLFPKKEVQGLERQMLKLEKNLGGIKEMDRLPGVLFVIDPRREKIAVSEARKLGIPVVAVVDTNCDPDEVDYIIPGNDDAIRAIRLMTSRIADACVDGKNRYEGAASEDADEEGEREYRESRPYVADYPKEAPSKEAVQPEVIVIRREETGQEA